MAMELLYEMTAQLPPPVLKDGGLERLASLASRPTTVETNTVVPIVKTNTAAKNAIVETNAAETIVETSETIVEESTAEENESNTAEVISETDIFGDHLGEEHS